MSLFFYGAIKLEQDAQRVSDALRRAAEAAHWELRLNELQREYSLAELFDVSKTDGRDYLVFELKEDGEGVYEKVYGAYGDVVMVQHYRNVASKLGVVDSHKLEFGTRDDVDEAYRAHPFELPVITFVQSMLDSLPNRDFVVCLDEGFENRFGCEERVCGRSDLLRSIWLTIAFGYTWPSIRLWYRPRVDAKLHAAVDEGVRIRTAVDIKAEFSDRVIPKGSMGTVVERYTEPELYAVDLEIPTDDLVGGLAFENVLLARGQFIVIDDVVVPRKRKDTRIS